MPGHWEEEIVPLPVQSGYMSREDGARDAQAWRGPRGPDVVVARNAVGNQLLLVALIHRRR